MTYFVIVVVARVATTAQVDLLAGLTTNQGALS
jgi:hypothetical protein